MFVTVTYSVNAHLLASIASFKQASGFSDFALHAKKLLFGSLQYVISPLARPATTALLSMLYASCGSGFLPNIVVCSLKIGQLTDPSVTT
jgi:hypothetical protein